MKDLKMKNLEAQINNLLYIFAKEEGIVINEIYVSKTSNEDGEVEWFDVSVEEENY